MKILTKLLAILLLVLPVAAYPQSVNQTGYDNTPTGGISGQKVDSGSHPLPVAMNGGGSSTTPSVVYQKNIGTTTYTKTTVALTGASQSLLAASSTRVGFAIYNPAANASVWVDLSGGTVASETGILVPAGGRFSVLGSSTPKTIITVIGTNTQSLLVWEGN